MIASLARLEKLTELYIRSCNVDEISEVRNMHALKALAITQNRGTITDWSPAEHVPTVNKGE